MEKEIQRKNMVRNQIAPLGLLDDYLLDAFLAVDRSEFLPKNLAQYAYEDRTLWNGCSVILKPMHLAAMFDASNLNASSKVLYVSACSYGAEVLSKICKKVDYMESLPKKTTLHDILICDYILDDYIESKIPKIVGIIRNKKNIHVYCKDHIINHAFDLLLN
jgi:hypothetical protein